MAQSVRTTAERPPNRSLFEIPLVELEDGPNVRARADAGLRKSILEHGVLQPITVAWQGDHFEVLYGHRRLAAARAAGLKTIPAIVEPAPRALAIRQLAENLDRRGLNQMDVARGLKSALEADPDLTKEALAARFGRKPSWVSQKLALLELDPELQQRIEDGTVNAYAALKHRPRANDGRGRPQIMPLPTEEARSRSIEIPIGAQHRGKGSKLSVGIEHGSRLVDVVVEVGEQRLFLGLSITEARLIGRRITQAAEALQVAVPA